MKSLKSIFKKDKIANNDSPSDDHLLPWVRLKMPEKDWRNLAKAFFSLAHSDSVPFLDLQKDLRDHPIGQLCNKYLETKDYKYIKKAGKELTGTSNWYVYLAK